QEPFDHDITHAAVVPGKLGQRMSAGDADAMRKRKLDEVLLLRFRQSAEFGLAFQGIDDALGRRVVVNPEPHAEPFLGIFLIKRAPVRVEPRRTEQRLVVALIKNLASRRLLSQPRLEVLSVETSAGILNLADQRAIALIELAETFQYRPERIGML